jgi:lipoate-protein ligase A
MVVMELQWRLIYSPALPAAWNMAIDEAMLLAHEAGLTIPTLRLYRWSPPAISLGLLQRIETINEFACRQLGFDIVRRPSGGGAVLHQHEVTYAIAVDGRICPEGSSVLATYRWLAQGLIAGLKKLGADASLPDQFRSHRHLTETFCFARLSGADLMVSGRKLGGSAQARRRYFLLQHGSIPLLLETEAIEQIFGATKHEGFTSLEEVLGRKVLPDEFVEAMVRGFSEALDIAFVASDLTKIELQLAELLFRYKYGTVEWTRERRTQQGLKAQIAAIIEEGIRTR